MWILAFTGHLLRCLDGSGSPIWCLNLPLVPQAVGTSHQLVLLQCHLSSSLIVAGCVGSGDAGELLPPPGSCTLRESRGLLCAPSARQGQENAQQRLYRVFSVGAHGKQCTVEFCTVNNYCRAPYLSTHGELSLSCITGRRTANKRY
jgi:hypothetical protein